MTNRKATTSFPVSLKMNSVCCPWAPKGGLKNANWPFFAFISVKTFSSRVVRHSLAYLTMHKWLVGDVPSTRNFGPKHPTPSKNGDFQSIFARSAWKIAPSEKSSIITKGFPMSLRWTAYVASKPPTNQTNTDGYHMGTIWASIWYPYGIAL